MRMITLAFGLLAALPAHAQDVDAILDNHVLPGYRALMEETAVFEDVAAGDCDPQSEALRGAYNRAFDAWIRVSHMRFGPTEVEERGFALAFWPDGRGSTPKTLAELIRDEDAVVESGESYKTMSVAARGFYAMEFLLYDAQFADLGNADYRCNLIAIVAEDIATTASEILNDWENGYADLMRNAGSNDIYRSEKEAVQQLFTALSTGLEFTGDMRLGRPLGTFERPRPKRAEVRRSGRSQRHVILSLEALRDLGSEISGGDAELDADFAAAIETAKGFDDPAFEGVTDPVGRIRVEGIKTNVDELRRYVGGELAPRLGIAAGFNALDGD